MIKIKLIRGDCLEEMQHIKEKIDMVLCDLPYGTTRCRWDTIIDLNKLWILYNKIIKTNAAVLLFSQTPFDKVLGCSNLDMLKYEWIWEKTQATGHLNAKKMPLKAHENILVFYKKLPTYNPQKTYGHKPTHSYTKYIDTQNRSEIYGVLSKEITDGGETDRYPRSVQIFKSDKQKNHIHSTQKPIALNSYLIKTYTNKNELVLDNCMGSGSTGISCIQTHRSFIGIEKDRKIFNDAVKRIKKYIIENNIQNEVELEVIECYAEVI